MEYLFLIIGIIIFLLADQFMKNIAWIGTIIIIFFIISIVRGFKDYKEFGFGFNDFLLLLLKIGGISFIVFLMCQ